MNKDGQVKLGSTPCDLCAAPGTVFIGSKIYCSTHAPQRDEKRASNNETLKNAHDRLADLQRG